MEPLSNPYFDPEPKGYFLCLKILGFVTLPTSALGLYCVFRKSPPSRSKFFKFLISHLIIVATVFELDLTYLSPPLLYLPYVALEFKGILSELGVPTEIQLEVLMTLIAASFGAIIPMVYHRMDTILPQSHWLNHLFIKFFVYATVFLVAYILPPMLIALCIQDQNKTKRAYLDKLHVLYDNFWSEEVVAVSIGFDNLFSLATVLAAFAAILAGNTALAVCGFIIYQTIRTRAAEAAMGSTLRHQALVGSVTTIILIFMVIIGVICPTITFLVLSNSYRADLLNVSIVIAAAIVPLTMLTYLLLFQPYASFVLSPLRKLVKCLRRRTRKQKIGPIYRIRIEGIQK